MPYSPYKNEAHEHQHKRFTAKGQLTGIRTIMQNLINDKDNFTKEERENFGRMFSITGDVLLKWENVLLKGKKKWPKKRLASSSS